MEEMDLIEAEEDFREEDQTETLTEEEMALEVPTEETQEILEETKNQVEKETLKSSS